MTAKFIFKRLSPKRIGQTSRPWQMALLVITLAMFALFALTAYAQEPADSEVQARGPRVAVVIGKKVVSNSAYMAANPELAVAGRYAEMAAQRAATEMSESIFLAANPELMLARRHVGDKDEVDPDRDIGLLDFFGPQTNKEGDPTVLAANPELSTARRYARMTEWQRYHFPGR